MAGFSFITVINVVASTDAAENSIGRPKKKRSFILEHYTSEMFHLQYQTFY